jgi:hypothetical protein
MKKICIAVLLSLMSVFVASGNNPPNVENPAALIIGSAISDPSGMDFGLQPPPIIQGGSSSISYTSKGLFLNIVPSYTSILNSDISKDNNWKINSGFGFNIEVGYLSKFNETIGVGFGVGYSSFSSEITSDPIENYVIAANDRDNDVYDRMVATSSLNEEISIGYIDIPIFLDVSNTNIDKIGYYGRVGIKISTPISNSITHSGTATIKGYYDQYNVLLYGIPPMGFYTNKEIYEDSDIELKPINFSLLVSGGISIPISNYVIIKVGANAIFGLTEISNRKAEDYDVYRYDGGFSKLLNNPNATTKTRSLGLEVGLIYNLRLY